MTTEVPETMRQLRSLVTSDGRLELTIATMETPQPQPNEVLVRIEAAPINPSDLGLLLATADLETATSGGTADDPVVTAPIPPQTLRGLAGAQRAVDAGRQRGRRRRGCRRFVARGAGAARQDGCDHRRGDLRRVPLRAGSAGSGAPRRHRPGGRGVVLRQPADRARHGRDDEDGGPQRARSHRRRIEPRPDVATDLPGRRRAARQHRAPPEQEQILRDIGADLRVRLERRRRSWTISPTALIATGATLAFDAIGGGRQAGQILARMEAAANASATEYSRYGSTVHKQVYIYGGLDRGPTEIARNFGMAWGIGGWLLTPFLGKIGLEGMVRLRDRVVAELTTTFASHYTDEVSLAGALNLDAAQGLRPPGDRPEVPHPTVDLTRSVCAA